MPTLPHRPASTTRCVPLTGTWSAPTLDTVLTRTAPGGTIHPRDAHLPLAPPCPLLQLNAGYWRLHGRTVEHPDDNGIYLSGSNSVAGRSVTAAPRS